MAKNCLKPNYNYPEQTNNYVELFADHSLTQTVIEPKRGENTLYLFATDNTSLIKKVTVIPGISDHEAVYVQGDVNSISYNKKAAKNLPVKKPPG